MCPAKVPLLPNLHGDNVTAIRARTNGPVDEDGLRCWICGNRRFHQWGSSLRCDKCLIYYVVSPARFPENFPQTCFTCGGRSMMIFPHMEACAKCGQTWNPAARVEKVHIVAAARVVAELVARSKISPSGTAIRQRRDSTPDSRAALRRDQRLTDEGLDPNVDHRRKKLLTA